MRKSILFCTIFFMISCKPTQLSTVNLMEQAPLIIYKTSADYNNKVPITLNEAGDKVLSFPGPSDMFTNGVLDKVIDPDPFLEMYDCGNWNEFQDSIKKINKIITQDFKGCKDLMIPDQTP